MFAAVAVRPQMGFSSSRGGTVGAVITVSASTDGIDQVLWMFNPEKIAAVSAK